MINIETIGKACLFTILLSTGCEVKAQTYPLKVEDVVENYLFAIDEAKASRDYSEILNITEGLSCQDRKQLIEVGIDYLRRDVPIDGMGMEKLMEERQVLDTTCKG